MKIFIYLFLFILIFVCTSFSQTETNHRFFGLQGGVKLINNQPQNIANIPNNNFFYYSTSLTDSLNNLLFLTNDSIRDKNYKAMPGNIVISSMNSGKSIYSVKMPGANNKYYIFYSRSLSPLSTFVLSYAIVDMSLQASLGAVTQMNIPIDTLEFSNFTIANKKYTDDFWLVFHKPKTDSFFSKLVTNVGVNNQYIKSAAGSHSIVNDYSVDAIVMSPNGKMIAETNNRYYPGQFPYTKSFIEVYNFNDQTGVVIPKVKGLYIQNYGNYLNEIEFSADNRLVYTHFAFGTNGLQPCDVFSNSIMQSNLCYSNEDDFSSFTIPVFNLFTFCNPSFMSEPKLFPNKKIYFGIGNTSSFSYLNNSNTIGTHSNYKLNVNSTTTDVNHLNSYYHHYLNKSVLNNIQYSGGCFPAPQTFKITNDTIINIQWNFGDINSGSNNIATGQNATHIFSSPGKYEVTATLYNTNNQLVEVVKDSIEQKDPNKRLLYNYPTDTVFCYGGSLNIKLDVINGIFEWWKKDTINGAIINDWVANQIDIDVSGYYYVKMRQNDCNGCHKIDSIHVTVVPKPIFGLGPDVQLCAFGDSTKIGVFGQALYPPFSTNYLWNTGAVTDSISVNQAGLYWLQLEYSYNNVGCSNRDSIMVTSNLFNYELPLDTVICNQSNFQVNINNSLPVSYLWNTGATTNSLNITSSGTYWLETTYNGCSKRDTIQVTFINNSQSVLGNDTSICLGNSLNLYVSLPNVNCLWSNGATSNSINVTSSGQYWVKVTANNCFFYDTINVQTIPLPIFSLGNDTSICERDFLVLKSNISNATYLWNNGSNIDSLLVTTSGTYWLKISKNGCSYTDTIMVNVKQNKKVNIGNDTLVCSNSSLILNAFDVTYQNYLWQNASTNSFYTVNAPGTYIVQATNFNGCISKDTANINFKTLPNFSLGSDTSICQKDTLVLNATISGATSYTWSTGATSQTIKAFTTNTYWCDVNKAGCIYRDSISLLVKPLPIVNLGNDTIICEDKTYLLNVINSNSSYLWQNGSIAPTFTVSQAGIYFVKVTKNGCIANDTTQVQYQLKPKFNLGADKLICPGLSFLLDPQLTTTGLTYFWNNGVTTPTFIVSNQGLFYVDISNNCGTTRDSIQIIKGLCKIYVPTAFTPNNDGINDVFMVSGGEAVIDFKLTIFNRWGQKIFASNNNKFGWNGKLNNIDQPSGAYIYFIEYKDFLTNVQDRIKGTIVLIR